MPTISEPRLRAAIERAGLPSDTWPRIHTVLATEFETSAQFRATHVAYYFGALLIIGAMGWFITQAWDLLPGVVLTVIAFLYAVVFGACGYLLSRRPSTRVPGGVLVTIAVCMTPMFVYGIERSFHLWPVGDPGGYSEFHPYINPSWVWMEICTILASLIALKICSFPFVTAPGAYALWYLSMDITGILCRHSWSFTQQAHISVVFGTVMLVAAYLVDDNREPDLAFWLYIFGLLTFTGGLSFWGAGNQLGKAIYCFVHLALIALSVVLQRRAFLVFGAIGVLFYLGDEARYYLYGSLSFTFALTAIGLVFIAAGLAYAKNEAALMHAFAPLVPAKVRDRHAHDSGPLNGA